MPDATMEACMKTVIQQTEHTNADWLGWTHGVDFMNNNESVARRDTTFPRWF